MLEQEGRAGEFGSGKGNEKEPKADPFVIDLYCMFVPLFIYCKFCMNSKFFIIVLTKDGHLCVRGISNRDLSQSIAHMGLVIWNFYRLSLS